jgi:hypothetical protein
MFQEANSYDNLYLVDQKVKAHEEGLTETKLKLELQSKITDLYQP